MSGAKKRNRFVVKTPENGDLNQYWYSPATIGAMVEEAVAEGTRVACLSTPSIFFSLPKEVRAVSAVLDLDDQFVSKMTAKRSTYLTSITLGCPR